MVRRLRNLSDRSVPSDNEEPGAGPGKMTKGSPWWNVIHGVAELNQVLWCTTSQANARDGVELELNTILNWLVEVPSDCSQDRIVFANWIKCAAELRTDWRRSKR